jgi:hypothetical protein
VDAADSPHKKSFSLQFATCSIRNYPLLLLLEPQFYTDQEAYKLLTKNVKKKDMENNRSDTN